MKRIFRINDSNETGSLSLEAAVVFPVYLLYVFLLFCLSISIKSDILWQEAAWSAVKESEIALTLSANYNLNEKKAFYDIKEIGIDFTADIVNSAFIKIRQEKWFRDSPSYNSFLEYFIRNPKGKIIREDGELYYQFSYALPLSLSQNIKEFKYPLAFWGDYGLDNEGIKIDSGENNETDDAENNVWNLDPFSRGKYFQEDAGSNLPIHFPTLSSFSDNTARSVKSIDLTAPSYQDLNAMENTITKYANSLEKFEGVENWGADNITISNKDILYRKLELVIPSNTSDAHRTRLSKIADDISKKGIELIISEKGYSSRYEDTKEE